MAAWCPAPTRGTTWARPATRTAFRTCPLCEAGCGLEITLAGRTATRGSPASGATATTCSATASSAPRARRSSSSTRTPTGCAGPLVKRDGALRRGHLGRGLRRGRAPARRAGRHPRPRRRRPSTSATPTPTAGRALYLRPLIKALGTTQPVLGQHGRPAAEAGGLGPDVRRRAHRPGARPRPHRLPADARRQPVRLQRQPGHRARLARPDRGADQPAAGRWSWSTPAGRARPRRRPAPRHPARHRRPPADGDGPRPRRRRARRRRARPPSTCPASTRCSPAARPFTPEAVAGVTGVDADVIRRLARDLAAAPTAVRLRPDRHHHGRRSARSRRGWSTCSTCSPATSTGPGGAMFTRAAAGASNTRGTPRVGRGFSSTAGAAGSGARRETLGELPVAALAEEIDTPGRGPDPGARHRGREPGAVDPQRGTARRGHRRPRVLRGRRPLRQRDDPPRRRDPAAPHRLQKGHYDLALLQLALRNVANYSPPVLPLDDGQLDEWKILARLALVAQGMGADADPAVVDDLVVRHPGRRGRRRRDGSDRRPRARRDPRACWASAPAPSGWST